MFYRHDLPMLSRRTVLRSLGGGADSVERRSGDPCREPGGSASLFRAIAGPVETAERICCARRDQDVAPQGLTARLSSYR